MPDDVAYTLRPEDLPQIDITRAREVTPDVSMIVTDAFDDLVERDPGFISRAQVVQAALTIAVKAIIQNVPPSPDRSAAIRKCREAAWTSYAGILHKGRY